MKYRSIIIVCASIAAGLVLCLLLHTPLRSADEALRSAEYSLRGQRTADSSVVIVYIDDEAIKSLGWPVRRNFHALMTKALTDLRVKAIGFEPVFEDERIDYPEYDTLFSGIMRSAHDVVLAGYFDSIDIPDSSASRSGAPTPFVYPRVGGVVRTGGGLHLPYGQFLDVCSGIGHLNLTENQESPLFIAYRDGVLPSFPLEVLRVALGGTLSYDGRNVAIHSPHHDVTFATSRDNLVALKYAGPISSFRAIPYLELLRSYDAVRADRPPEFPVLALKDKIILIGVIAKGNSTFISTPVDPRLPSLVYHATFIDNALSSGFLIAVPQWFVYLCGIFAAALSTWIVFRFRSPLSLLLVAGFGFVVLGVSYLLFVAGGVLLPVMPIFMLMAGGAVPLFLLKQRETHEEVNTLRVERERIAAELRDKEAKLAILERDLVSHEAQQSSDKVAELVEEIRKYKAEIRTLSSKADDMEPFNDPHAEPGSVAEFEGIVHDSAGKMKPVIDFVKKISESDAPVLVLGQSGTGKELIAQAIHRRSKRSAGPFIAVNCSALSENLLESELFGHEKGSFTGAVKDRLGRFELADNGTIFLDEIGEVSEGFQLKLLRVLQEGELERVGGSKTLRVNVRVIAATNKDLRRQMTEKKFREDLYYRLNVLSVALPPLKERQGDIPALARHFLSRADERLKLSRNFMEALRRYSWPGNVRELESAITRAVLLAKSEQRDMLGMNDLTDEITSAVRGELAVEDEILEMLRNKGFSRSSISETADALGGMNRGTVAEYLRGESLKAFVEQMYDREKTVHVIALSADPAVRDRVAKKLQEYLSNIAEAVATDRPWETVRGGLKTKTKNLPQRYHQYLEQVGEAFYRGMWKM